MHKKKYNKPRIGCQFYSTNFNKDILDRFDKDPTDFIKLNKIKDKILNNVDVSIINFLEITGVLNIDITNFEEVNHFCRFMDKIIYLNVDIIDITISWIELAKVLQYWNRK